MKSFWEETLFTVVERRDPMPVYKIQSIKDTSDIRVVHRNLIMKCDQLPLDVFEEKVDKKAATQPKQKKKIVKSKNEVVHTIDSESEDEGDDIVILYHDYPSGGSTEVPETENLPVREEIDEIEEVVEVGDEISDPEEPEEVEVVEERTEENEVVDDASADDESEDEDAAPLRRSGRTRTKTQILTYNEVGGNPSTTVRGT